MKQENEELKEFKKIAIDNADKVYNKMLDYCSALEEIRNAIIEYLPKKQGDYNFSKSFNPAEYALLEYIQLQINEVLGNENQ